MSCENLVDHTDFVTAHPAQSLQGVRAPQLGIKDRPVSCYRLEGGVFEEGIALGANSSLQMCPALFVGDWYVLIDPANPCAYGDDHVVYRASIRKGGKGGTVPLLTQRAKTDNRILVYVDTRFARVPRTVFKEAFSAKIVTDGGITAWSRSKNEMLVSLGNGETIEVLYADGTVRQVINENGTAKAVPLSLEDQAAHRAQYLAAERERVRSTLTGDPMIKTVDKLFHELVAILRIGGARSQAVFDLAYRQLEDAGEAGLLGTGVQRHVREVLEEQDRKEHLLRFSFTCTKRGVNGHTTAVPTATRAVRRKGPSPERQAKLAERSQRDREARQGMRGSSEDRCLQGKRSNGKK
ncbi:MAG TPA: hypothetical protein VGE23_00545 [Candidatus Paceibacterota bacterium]